MPAKSRENPLTKTGNFDAFFREKYLTKNKTMDADSCAALPAGRTEQKFLRHVGAGADN